MQPTKSERVVPALMIAKTA